jgi:predicted metalloprotease with PDZ domain
MKKLTVFLLMASICVAAHTQKIAYKVSFPNAVHHEAHIELTVTGITAKPAIFRMSRSSPGRYATHEFGKNVYDVTAKDKTGKNIIINRTDGDVYAVPSHNGTVTISYTLYANYPDGTYAGVDPESIHLNMPAAFMWIKGMDKTPIEISFDLPRENKGVYATQLVPTNDPNTFTAPGLQYFMDSPTKIGDLIMRQWNVTNPDGKTYSIRIGLEAAATNEQADELAEKIKRMVEEAGAVFGEYPKYDYGTYTFIASANPYVQGDGMEHRNSTMISTPMASFSANRLLGVFSHEYFHNWNVERIRPKTLEPFNFEKSNMSNELWFAEGFTQYYGDLLLARAGMNDRFLNTVGSLANAKMNAPGAKFYSPVQASNHAVFVDASVSIDKNNYGNMFTSYYFYGAAVALALELELQTRFNKSLDDYMREMWKRFGKPELPYTVATMEQALAAVTNASFAADFFRKYINGHEPIDYAALLAKAGYELKKSGEGKASIGLSLSATDQTRAVIGSNTIKGSAAYEAGLDTGDEIVKLDDTSIKNTSELNSFVQSKKPGDVITVTYKHRGLEKKTSLVLKEQTSVTVVPFEQSGKTVTDDMKRIRTNWMGTHVK